MKVSHAHREVLVCELIHHLGSNSFAGALVSTPLRANSGDEALRQIGKDRLQPGVLVHPWECLCCHLLQFSINPFAYGWNTTSRARSRRVWNSWNTMLDSPLLGTYAQPSLRRTLRFSTRSGTRVHLTCSMSVGIGVDGRVTTHFKILVLWTRIGNQLEL